MRYYWKHKIMMFERHTIILKRLTVIGFNLSVSNNTSMGLNNSYHINDVIHLDPHFQLNYIPLYENMYSYSLGNASLQPMISHVNWYTFDLYVRIYLNVICTNMNNYIGHTYYTDEKQPSLLLHRLKLQ